MGWGGGAGVGASWCCKVYCISGTHSTGFTKTCAFFPNCPLLKKVSSIEASVCFFFSFVALATRISGWL